MKDTVLIAGLVLAFGAWPVAVGAPASPSTKHYVCPPCGSPCDSRVFEKPGTCPVCGMPLVEQGSANAVAAPSQRVAILIFDGVEIIDFAGPYEVFGAANFDVYTVAAAPQPVTTSMGLTVVPKFTFGDAPPPDILIVPGGAVRGARSNAALVKWVATQAARADHTMSVCNGAFILGSAGLLDGLTATTTAGLIDGLRAEFPKARVVDDQRYVDNGKIITTAGLSAGIDGALHLLSVLKGEGFAQAVALRVEYDWRPSSGFARAALADRELPDLGAHDPSTWELLATRGGTDRWELVMRPRTDTPTGDVMDHFHHLLTDAHWSQVKASADRSEWKFTGRGGRAWTGTLTLEPPATSGARRAVKLTIARAG